MADNPTPAGAMPSINRVQIESARQAAEQQIAVALHAFALQLPQGTLYEQEALNEAGAILDRLLRRTGQYDEAAQFQPDPSPNPDMAAQRDAVAGAEESTEIKDYNSGG
jgi:outer membrane protein assembly factor BamA